MSSTVTEEPEPASIECTKVIASDAEIARYDGLHRLVIEWLVVI